MTIYTIFHNDSSRRYFKNPFYMSVPESTFNYVLPQDFPNYVLPTFSIGSLSVSFRCFYCCCRCSNSLGRLCILSAAVPVLLSYLSTCRGNSSGRGNNGRHSCKKIGADFDILMIAEYQVDKSIHRVSERIGSKFIYETRSNKKLSTR